jgi:hypothetical protein
MDYINDSFVSTRVSVIDMLTPIVTKDLVLLYRAHIATLCEFHNIKYKESIAINNLKLRYCNNMYSIWFDRRLLCIHSVKKEFTSQDVIRILGEKRGNDCLRCVQVVIDINKINTFFLKCANTMYIKDMGAYLLVGELFLNKIKGNGAEKYKAENHWILNSIKNPDDIIKLRIEGDKLYKEVYAPMLIKQQINEMRL